MDKIAVISDVHGNIPALEAVFNDISLKGIDRIICLGDLAGKGPNSDLAVDMLRDRCESVVAGNWDYGIANPNPNEPKWLRLDWYRAQLGQQRLDYMKTLPVYLEFYMSGRLLRLCHASPHDLWHRTYVTTARPQRLKLFEPTATLSRQADVIGYGDIHGAHIDNIEGRTIFNAGSVGNPLDMTQAAYAVIEGFYGSEAPSSFSISIVRVPYDIEQAVQDAQASDMPYIDEYVSELRTAVYRGLAAKKA